MSRFTAIYVSSRVLGITVGLALWGWSSAAVASCGDYVHLGRAAAKLEHEVDRELPRIETPMAQMQHKSAPRCQGPDCRGEVPRDPPRAPTPAVPVVEQWGCLAGALAEPTRESGGCVIDNDSSNFLIILAGVLRPPRVDGELV